MPRLSASLRSVDRATADNISLEMESANINQQLAPLRPFEFTFDNIYFHMLDELVNSII